MAKVAPNKTSFSAMEQERSPDERPQDDEAPESDVAPQANTETQAGKAPAMTPQQQRFSARGSKGLSTYRNLWVGDRGWGSLVGYELYNLLLCGLPGILGYAGRSLALRSFLDSYGKGTMVGRNVLIRQPARVSLGSGVILDDYCVLDLRDKAGKPSPSITLGDYVFVGRQSSIVAKGGSIRLGAACNVSSHCRLATESSIEIGDSVLIASYVYIGPGNHQRDEQGRVLIDQEMEIGSGVRIGNGCWIGTRVTILDGVTIGDNAIVGAHSLVREDVPAGAVVAGTPAKIISREG